MGLFGKIFNNQQQKPTTTSESLKTITEKVDDLFNFGVLEALEKSTLIKEGVSADETCSKMLTYEAALTPAAFNLFDSIEFIVFGDKSDYSSFNFTLSVKNNKLKIDDIIKLTNALDRIFQEYSPFNKLDAEMITEGLWSKVFMKDDETVFLSYEKSEGLTLTRH